MNWAMMIVGDRRLFSLLIKFKFFDEFSDWTFDDKL